MSRTTWICAAALFVALLCNDTQVFGETRWRFLRVRNDGPVTILAEILHSDGDLQKKETLKPSNGHLFEFGMKIGNTHTRKFRITEKLSNTVIAYGTFKMSVRDGTGAPFVFDECIDTPDDQFKVTCTIPNDNERYRGKVHIERLQ